MANLSQFVFWDRTSTVLESNPFGNANQSSAMTVQVISDGADFSSAPIKFYGSVDMKEGVYAPLKVINLKNFKTVEEIKTEDIYMVLTDGVAYVKCTRDSVAAPTKVFGVGLS